VDAAMLRCDPRWLTATAPVSERSRQVDRFVAADGSIAEIDHIAFGAARVESAHAGFARVGFSLTRGACAWSTAAGTGEGIGCGVIFDTVCGGDGG
jgi:hypothetical protein